MFNPKSGKQNNKGSAIITVVISMLFVMTLGAALLFAAYTGYSITLTQQGDKENFYDASSAMDDMRLGVQTLLSSAMSEAYTGILTTYIADSAASNYNPQTTFNSAITQKLLSKAVTINSVSRHYFTSNDGGLTITGYNADAMTTLIDTAAQPYSTVTGSTAAVNSTTSAISLKSLNVEYSSSTGYKSIITSDITITMPYFYACSAATSSINNYAIVANTGITESGSGRHVNGSVFAGSGGLTTSLSGDSLTLENGDLICKGPLTVVDGSAITYDAPSNELWASEITVGAMGTANIPTTLNGNVYVADDLVLNAAANVTLINTYFGFGNSTNDSSQSSSILINGRGTTLNINGLNKLSLAGISFIDTLSQTVVNSVNAPYTAPIPMGESMSIKTDQLAYLVPAECISNYETNPCFFASGDTVPAPTITPSTVLWGTKTLADYIGTPVSGYTYSKCVIQPLYKPFGDGLKIGYVFLVFKDKSYANEYFKDYFAADPTKISQYMSLYLNLSGKADNAIINTAGNTFYTASGGTLALNAASDTIWASGASTQFTGMTSPYAAFVNTTKLATLNAANPPLQFKNAVGDVVALVTNADYAYTGSSPNTVHLIISSGNVTISSPYTGIVIAGGTVAVNNNVTSVLLDTKMLNATCSTDASLKLSDFINNSSQFLGTTTSANDSWNLNSLVFYENWTKK